MSEHVCTQRDTGTSLVLTVVRVQCAQTHTTVVAAKGNLHAAVDDIDKQRFDENISCFHDVMYEARCHITHVHVLLNVSDCKWTANAFSVRREAAFRIVRLILLILSLLWLKILLKWKMEATSSMV